MQLPAPLCRDQYRHTALNAAKDQQWPGLCTFPWLTIKHEPACPVYLSDVHCEGQVSLAIVAFALQWQEAIHDRAMASNSIQSWGPDVLRRCLQLNIL